VLLAIPPADFQLHNSLFLVAHFHNVIIGGVVFGAFAGYTFWFPKAFGFRLHDGLGRAVFWCWFIGFWLAFMPLYVLGLMGATRRMQRYPELGWQPFMIVAFVGALVILAGIVLTIVQLVVSVRQRERLRDATGDPWDGRTLEWATRSPPPAWNFTALPQVDGLDAFWQAKRRNGGTLASAPGEGAQPLELPRPSALGVVVAFFAFVGGFALVWHIWWLALLGLGGVVAAGLARAWQTGHEFEVEPAVLAAFEAGGART
jgi:cytochrome o ubiquinol oxidase subunit 1